MARRTLTAVAILAVSLTGSLAAFVAPAGAAAPSEKTYSAADCAVITQVNTDTPVSGDTSGYDRAQLTAIGNAYADAADQISDKKLAAGMKTLGKLYVTAGKSKTQMGALLSLGKAGKSFGKALKVVLGASMGCLLSDITLPDLNN